MQRIISTIDWINESVGRAASWLTFVLVLFVCYDVFNRRVFNETAAWIPEMEWHLFALVFLLGAGYSFRHDKHVRVDLFYSNFIPKDKALVNLIGGLLFLIPWCVVIIIFSFRYALDSFRMGEGSADPGGLPFLWIIKFMITLGIFLLMLQAIAEVLRSVQILRNPTEAENLENNTH